MVRRSTLWARMALCFLIPVGACDCGDDDAPINECARNTDCEDGQRCVDRMCVGGSGDGGMDGGADAGGDTGDGCEDLDRDGYDGLTESCPDGDDCDDTNPNINPGDAEVCGDTLDNDCDGMADEPDCECTRGDRIACYGGPAETAGVGVCRSGITVCVEDGVTDDCRGAILPGEETCDGTDEDCDGSIDEGLLNACGVCGAPEPEEQCGNELDDDCDGMVDEDCNCDYRCLCPEGTSCECEPPINQPCYEGPFGTGGVGVCAGGRRDCVTDDATGENRWEMCEGQTLPSMECEGGANGDDDDCDGVVDEGCADVDGDGSTTPDDCDDSDADIYPGATETCNDRDDDCDGVADEGATNACGGCGMPAAEDECGNGLDDDCDGTVDDGCSCDLGEEQECYGGPAGTQGVGRCLAGTQTCTGNSEFPGFSECEGQVLPLPEICNGIDDDCDGEEDERWATGSNACGFCDPTEICDGEDQDCDGLVDEGVANACGECGEEPVEICDGEDQDCDGKIDEGTTNACGTCPPEPCFTDGWPEPADCETEGRDCEGVEEHPDYPGSITLGESNLDFDYIYLAVTRRNMVAQLNTSTGVRNWLAPSHGTFPSRTAVAEDGSVWVSNRGLGGDAGNINQSNIVHLSAEDGSLICRAPVLNVARSVAIDRYGDVWAGSYNNGDLFHISGTMVDESTTPPTCIVINRMNVGTNIYGLAADAEGNVWTSTRPVHRINATDYTMTSFTNPSFYGIAADGEGRMWYGGWGGGGTVHALNRETGAITNTTVRNVTGVTVHPEGSIWGSSYGTNQIVGINSDGTQRCLGAVPSGRNPHGIAVDRMGRLWMPSRFGSGTVNVYDTMCNHLHTYNVDAGQELYSYSDMTGHLLRTFVAPEGNWSQVFDSGYELPYWTNMTWSAIVPDGAVLEMSARTADTEAGLEDAVPCGPFTTSPADLSTCPADFHRHRYLRIEAHLESSTEGARPILMSVDASWAY